ncbi:thiamine phosphate synthase [Acidipila sp. EB88]|uniref:thiamine phosphate synthase n=1 Tax=Acidipila sp. EB88 TaxID=2305226 RepID=UPI000F5EE237|nr:thiamine phosphate synthase [Acidipila sp. EB88]RRA49738.1 thiamine phosphate synthase [Acidipila sp. EB88]
MALALPPLYPILDSAFFPADPATCDRYLTEMVHVLTDAGVTLLQLRMKGAAAPAILHAAHVLHAASPPSLRLILNDAAPLLAASGFHGVHLGQADMPVAQARAALGSDVLIGISTHTLAQLEQGGASSADYIATGPVFATGSKADAEPHIGLDGVRLARGVTARPLVAIGGITPYNAESVRDAGADSLAVIGAIFAQPGTRSAASPAEAGRLAADFLKLFR